MYKVKPEDRIPTRTSEEAAAGLGAFLETLPKQDPKKVEKLWDAFAKHSGNGHSVNAVMRNAYKFADLVMEPMKKYSVCAVGCSHCCKLNVSITDIEAMFIEKNTKYTAVQQHDHSEPTHIKNKDYCTFHDDASATCKIWEFRPISCRFFYTLDSPTFCEDPMMRHTVSAQHGAPKQIHLKELHKALVQFTPNARADIRQFFPPKK